MRAVLLALALAACGGSDAPAPTTPFASDGTHLRDDRGRVVLLRGVNARVDGIFDVTFADGRAPLEPVPPLVADDCAQMHAMGLDFLRLPINWSAVEPQRGQYDDAYLDRVDAAVRCAESAQVYVMIDLHQDAYSKEIGEDGAPLWAIQPAPTKLLEGPLNDLGDRRLSAQVTNAFTTFFDQADPAGLQADFEAMLEHVAARFADDPAVIGFELFNEPTVADKDVIAFSTAAAARVRAVAPKKLVMFEPSATRNLFDFVTPSPTAFPVADAVYAPHIYTLIFQNPPDTFEPAVYEDSVSAARAEATAWKTPLMIGEYGTGPTAKFADAWMHEQAMLHDKYFASDAFWVWKEESQASWGVFDHDATTGAWTPRPQVVAWLARVHAARIAGRDLDNAFDPATGTLTLHATATGGVPHVIYVPTTTATATCEGAALPITGAPGFVELPCDGTLVVNP